MGGGGGGGGEAAIPAQMSQCWSKTWLPCCDVVLLSGVEADAVAESTSRAKIPPPSLLLDLESELGFLDLDFDSCLDLEPFSCLILEPISDLEDVEVGCPSTLTSPLAKSMG